MKAIVSDLSEVPEALRGEYEERDGRYVLRLEGEVPGLVPEKSHRELRDKVNRFRDNYTGVMKRLKEVAGVEDMGDDLGPLVELINGMKSKLEEAQGGKSDFNTEIQKALKPLRDELAAEKAAREEATQRANRATLRQNVGSALSKHGAKANAMDFLLSLAERVFEVRDDEVSARDGQLDANGDPLSPKDWIASVIKEHDYAFESSTGGGSGGSGPGNGGVRVQPGVKILRNPSPTDLGKYSREIAEGKMQIVND